MARKYRRGIDWSWLRSITETSLNGSSTFQGPVRLAGRMDWLRSGLYHDNYRFSIEGAGVPEEWREEPLLLRISKQKDPPLSPAEAARSLLREAKTLQIVGQSDIQFETPGFVCMVQSEGKEPVGFIETWERGVQLDSYRRSSYHDRIIPTIAGVAGSVHRLAKGPFGHLESSRTREEYILDELQGFPPELFDGFPAAGKAKEWILARLSHSRPTVVLHGDLLPQNIMCMETEGDWRVAVIDWQFARIGDPAYDLAIVTRGNRKLLGMDNALALLVEAYLQAGGADLSVLDVRVHELILMLNWLSESVDAVKENRREGGHAPEHYEQRLGSLLCRAGQDD